MSFAVKGKFENKKIGIFGGSFNPLHYGHQNFARYVLSKNIVDHVIFVPVYRAPHKSREVFEKFYHRKKIISLVLHESFSEEHLYLRDQVRISSIEKKLSIPNYSYRTMRAFKNLLPESQLYMMMGMDSYTKISSWKNPELIRRHPIIIAMREEENRKIQNLSQEEKVKLNEDKRFFLKNPDWDFSSSEIRYLIREYHLQNDSKIRDKLESLMGKNALDYIIKMGLYK